MEIENFRPGVLNKKQLQLLESKGIIQDASMSEDPESAFDLRIGDEYWEMAGCIKGIGRHEPYYRILQNSRYCVQHKENLSQLGKVKLQSRRSYVFRVRENIRYYREEYKNRFHAFATGKSSIGRLDVLVRLVEDSSPYYDRVSPDNPGSLFLEVTPITFNVEVKPNIMLNQLRVFYGHPKLSEINPDELQEGYWGEVIVDENGRVPEDVDKLTLNLKPVSYGNDEFIAFQALTDNLTIDLTSEEKLDPHEYWRGIKPSRENTVEIKKGSFYILRSRERFKLPEDIAVYCEAVSEEFGEIRIHYAGFVHPCFGLYRDIGKGAPLTLEVRGHTLDTFLRHGETLATVKYYRMSQPHKYQTEDIKKEKKQGYSSQELNLSKIFKTWD